MPVWQRSLDSAEHFFERMTQPLSMYGMNKTSELSASMAVSFFLKKANVAKSP